MTKIRQQLIVRVKEYESSHEALSDTDREGVVDYIESYFPPYAYWFTRVSEIDDGLITETIRLQKGEYS